MTNPDTSTLNGSLEQLGITMADNLVAKGVSASASDGLTTLANKILDIQTGGGSCYHIKFSQNSYTAFAGSVTLECTLQSNYAPLSGVSVILSDGTSQYTNITDSNGVATFNLTGLTVGGTYTCSYSNVSDSCTVTVVSYLFYDNCSADNTSQYDTVVRIGNNATSNSATLSYSTDHYLASISSTRDAWFGWVIPNTRGLDNIRISVKSKISTSSAYNQLFIGCADNIAQSSTGTYDLWRIRGDNKSDYLHNSGNEVSGSSATTNVYNRYVWLVFEKQGTTIVGKVYDENETLLRTYTYSSANSYSNPYYFFGVNTNRSADTKLIQEIKAESITN